MSDEHLEKLRDIADGDWQMMMIDRDDREAIRWALADRDRLRRERNALLVGMMIYKDVDGSDDNLVRNLEDPEIRTAHVESAVTATEVSPFAKYLDLPSDLKAPSPAPEKSPPTRTID